jgi:hypothetical protein
MKQQSGQVLLIIILLSTVLLTIGLSVSQITTQETKITKLEEDSKKAFAAAEAGIEKAIKLGSGTTIPIEIGGVTGTAEVQSTQGTAFITPLLKKDEQYTFYMASDNFSTYFSGDLIFYLYSGSSCPTLELTFISNSNGLTRRLIDPCNPPQISSDIPTTNVGAPFNFQGTSFNYKIDPPLAINNIKLIIARVLFAETKIGIGSSGAPPPALPLQGKTIISSATTLTGVNKRIQLFQSLMQIPADFFTTSF